MVASKQSYAVLRDTLADRGIDIGAVKSAVKSFAVETPSWAYGDGGTRFHVFNQPGAARNILEKLHDAAFVHKLTGVTPSVAVHMLWDFVDVSVAEAHKCARSLKLKIGAINPTLFEQPEYKYGSLGSPQKKARDKALSHILDSIEAMRQVKSKYLSLWFADGTNYPGQDDFRRRKRAFAAGLKSAHDAMDKGQVMLLEYKFFEPSFYSTDVGDWGMAYMLSKQAGTACKVLVDLGHHPLGTNIEQIVAWLIDEDMLGGFHFNSKKYADDDLTSGSMSPYELFLIFNELVAAGGGKRAYKTAYMIDQSHNLKLKIEAMIQTVMTLQETLAKALCVDRKGLKKAQNARDLVAAENILKDAFYTDVRGLLASVRKEMGLNPDPLEAYRASGYQQKIEKQRGKK